MKKHLVKILALILAICSFIGVFSGCSLVKTNTKKDANLVVAKIKINDDVEESTIYKKDMYAGYLSYGYYYVQYYGYSASQAFELILQNLVQSGVIEQFSKWRLTQVKDNIKQKTTGYTEFEEYFKTVKGFDTLTAKSDITAFLTEYQLYSARYEFRKSINNMIESLVDKEDEETPEKEEVTLTERATPYEEDDTEYKDWELKTKTPTEDDYLVADLTLKVGVDELKDKYKNLFDLNFAVYKAYTIDLSTKERRVAFNLGLVSYKNTGVIDKDEYYDTKYDETLDELNIEKYSYFRYQLHQAQASILVEQFQNSLIDGVKAKLNDEMLYNDYCDLYDSQESAYKNSYTAYETALSAMSDTNLVVYSPYDGYGFVSNLLIGFTDEQTSALSTYSSADGRTKDEITAYRNKLAENTVVKDQRAYWVTSGYGEYEEVIDTFTFDRKYFKATNESLLLKLETYNGEVVNPVSTEEEQDNGLKKTVWSASNAIPTAIDFNEFYQTILQDEFGFSALNFYIPGGNNEIKSIGFSKAVLEAMDDVIYAYSTDSGSLGTYCGYLYSPFTSSTTYVSEFAACAKDLVENGIGSYALVVTDYGIHIMVCTLTIDKSTKMTFDEFVALGSIEGTTAYKFKKVKLDALVDTQVQSEASKFTEKYLKDDSTAVTYYKGNYSDLITE